MHHDAKWQFVDFASTSHKRDCVFRPDCLHLGLFGVNKRSLGFRVTCSRTVPTSMAPLDTSPFLASHQLTHALQSFPHSLPPTSSLLSIEAVRTWALDSGVDPLHPALLFCTVLSGIVFVLGELTGKFIASAAPSCCVQPSVEKGGVKSA